MTGEPTERDVEELARLLTRQVGALLPLELAAVTGAETLSATARAVLRSDWYAERIAQARREGAAEARLDGRCASCGEPATTTSRPNGRLALVCLRHFNVWQTPAALRGDA